MNINVKLYKKPRKTASCRKPKISCLLEAASFHKAGERKRNTDIYPGIGKGAGLADSQAGENSLLPWNMVNATPANWLSEATLGHLFQCLTQGVCYPVKGITPRGSWKYEFTGHHVQHTRGISSALGDIQAGTRDITGMSSDQWWRGSAWFTRTPNPIMAVRPPEEVAPPTTLQASPPHQGDSPRRGIHD